MGGFIGTGGGGGISVERYADLPPSGSEEGAPAYLTLDSVLLRWSINAGRWVPDVIYDPEGAAGVIPGVIDWIDAGDIEQDDATAVATWANRTGLGDYTNSNAGQRPTYFATEGPGGLPAVAFLGAQRLVRSGALVHGRAMWGWAVIVVWMPLDTTNGAIYSVASGTAVGSARAYLWGNPTTWQYIARHADGGTARTINLTDKPSLAEYKVLNAGSWKDQEQSGAPYVIGDRSPGLPSSDDLITTADTATQSNTNSLHVSLGSGSNNGTSATNPSFGYLSGLMYLQGDAASPTNVRQLTRYLQSRWGL